MPKELPHINKNKLPNHVAIIMDGNGRWAQENDLHRIEGHKHGVYSVREVTEACAEIGISYLTLFAFSTENWDRPQEEVHSLMELLVETIKNEVSTLNKNNIKLKTIGDTESLPKNAQINLAQAIQETSHNTGLTLLLALSYSARWEIKEAMKQIGEKIKRGELSTAITDEMINQHLCTFDIPDPDLLIRTSGEHRISNFLLWQVAYTELYFTNTLWPNFRKKEFYEAIVEYQHRERRFGKTSSQINTHE